MAESIQINLAILLLTTLNFCDKNNKNLLEKKKRVPPLLRFFKWRFCLLPLNTHRSHWLLSIWHRRKPPGKKWCLTKKMTVITWSSCSCGWMAGWRDGWMYKLNWDFCYQIETKRETDRLMIDGIIVTRTHAITNMRRCDSYGVST